MLIWRYANTIFSGYFVCTLKIFQVWHHDFILEPTITVFCFYLQHREISAPRVSKFNVYVEVSTHSLILSISFRISLGQNICNLDRLQPLNLKPMSLMPCKKNKYCLPFTHEFCSNESLKQVKSSLDKRV